MNKAASKKGFTILELLIVIAVISIIVGIALPRFKGMQDEGNIAKAKGDLRTLQTAVESHYIHNSSTYPATLAAMTADKPNIVSSIPDDPFAAAGTKYVYVLGGTNSKYYIIYSVGSDGAGSAAIAAGNTVTEVSGSSCIYVSNMSQDSAP